MSNDIKRRFDSAMLNIYKRALKEAHYKATRYLQMLNEHGGIGTAKELIRSEKVSDGYAALWERKRLDLTVEALIFENPEWQQLFSEEELEIIRKRLVEYKYGPAIKSS